MSNHARVILWLGMLMILVQIARDWSQIKVILFQRPGGKAGSSGILPSPPAPFNILPHVGPILTWPGTTIPIA